MCFSLCKSAQIEEAVNALDRDQLDILMKYIYRGFETSSEDPTGQLLVWHEKVNKKMQFRVMQFLELAALS